MENPLRFSSCCIWPGSSPAMRGLLLVIILFGAWLRMNNLTAYPTWWDEHVSVFSASGQIATQGEKFDGRVSRIDGGSVKVSALGDKGFFQAGDVLALKKIGNIPAATLFWDRGNGLAFDLLLSAWVAVFGFSDVALRALPCLLGVLAIPAVFAVGVRATKLPWVGLLASLFVACNAVLVQFSQEVRPYSLAVLLCLLATYTLLGFFEDNLRRPVLWALLYAALLVALGFTHYLAVPVLVGAHFLGGLVVRSRWKVLGAWAGGVLALALTMAVWMAWGGGLGLQAMREHDQVWLQRATSGMFWWLTVFDWRTGVRLLIERTIQFNMPHYIFWPPQGWINCLALGVFLMAALMGLLAMLRSSGAALLAGAAIFAAASAGGALSLYLSWKSGHTVPFIDRYFTFYIPFQSLLLSVAICGVARIRSRRLLLPVAAVLISGSACMIFVNVSGALSPKEKESFSFDKVVQSIGSKLPPGTQARCDSPDSALILALKTAKKYPDLRIVIDPKAESKASIQTVNSSNNIPSHE